MRRKDGFMMFHPIKAILRRMGYAKFTKIDRFTPELLREIREKQPREYWDDIARSSPTRPRPAQ